jgi:hypothetical protein
MVLSDLAKLIRSKNAGPFLLTFDIMFDDADVYRRVQQSGILTPLMFADMYGCDESQVKFFECPNALAFKFTIPRRRVEGSFGDSDLHGGQQYAPLMDLVIPDDEHSLT